MDRGKEGGRGGATEKGHKKQMSKTGRKGGKNPGREKSEGGQEDGVK